MKSSRLKPSIISYNLALGACAKARAPVGQQGAEEGEKESDGDGDSGGAEDATGAAGASAGASRGANVASAAPTISSAKGLSPPSWELEEQIEDAVGAGASGSGLQTPQTAPTAGEQAIELLHEIRQAGLSPDVVSYSSAISALSRAGDYERVIGMLGAMTDEQLEPNAFSWSAAIAACERAGEQQKALALFAGLRDAGGAADSAVYHAAISAAASGGDVNLARTLLSQMSEEADAELSAPSLRAYNGAGRSRRQLGRLGRGGGVMAELTGSDWGRAPTASPAWNGRRGGRAGEWERALELWRDGGGRRRDRRHRAADHPVVPRRPGRRSALQPGFGRAGGGDRATSSTSSRRTGRRTGGGRGGGRGGGQPCGGGVHLVSLRGGTRGGARGARRSSPGRRAPAHERAAHPTERSIPRGRRGLRERRRLDRGAVSALQDIARRICDRPSRRGVWCTMPAATRAKTRRLPPSRTGRRTRASPTF